MAGDGTQSPRKSRILEIIEVLSKLIGASAVLLVALFANSLQSRLTGVSIQSQREQAESQLRANMFSSLISPLGGPQTDGKPMSADREVLLTQLLALNFNENFEMKPLMEDAALRLAVASGPRAKDADDPREALWSVARRIAERQRASISREWSVYNASQNQRSWPLRYFLGPKPSNDAANGTCQAFYLNLDSRRPPNGEPVSPGKDCQVMATFRDIIDLKSPDGHTTLRVAADNPNWSEQTVKLTSQPFLTEQSNPSATDTQYNFHLSWLDMPLTDNTLLADGNRFAVYMRAFYNDFQTVSITVMWFPKGYFTPRERPLNYSEVQSLLGTKTQ